MPASHNMQKRLVAAVVSRSLSVPTAAVSASRRNRNPVTEPWDGRVHRSFYVNTSHPETLVFLGLGPSQHRVMAESVAYKDGVVEAFLHGGSLA